MKKSLSSNSREGIFATKPMTEKDAENLDCFFREVALSPGGDEVKWHEPGQWGVDTPIYAKPRVRAWNLLPDDPFIEIPLQIEIDPEFFNFDPKLYTPGPIMMAGRALAPESSWNDS